MLKSGLSSTYRPKNNKIVIHQQLSKPFDLGCGVPQGSCLGPILFLLYASGLFKVMAKHLPRAHACADDSQLYFYFKPDSSTCQREAIKVIEECIAAVRIWMISHRRLIKDTKTEFLIIGSCQ